MLKNIPELPLRFMIVMGRRKCDRDDERAMGRCARLKDVWWQVGQCVWVIWMMVSGARSRLAWGYVYYLEVKTMRANL